MTELNSKRALAENLRQNMYDLKLTQKNYAKQVAIPYTTMLYAISGKGSISLSTLDRIAEGTGLDPWELIKPPK